ncbi:hypothetical protein BD413DRAFT_158595 [Trametes elegans]|nr:hypothetical protein BD413DRAFT_158595 [Trametes elegans]
MRALICPPECASGRKDVRSGEPNVGAGAELSRRARTHRSVRKCAFGLCTAGEHMSGWAVPQDRQAMPPELGGKSREGNMNSPHSLAIRRHTQDHVAGRCRAYERREAAVPKVGTPEPGGGGSEQGTYEIHRCAATHPNARHNSQRQPSNSNTNHVPNAHAHANTHTRFQLGAHRL